MLDPAARQLGSFFNAASVPWNAYIDPRTMEILFASVGGFLDVKTSAARWIRFVDSNPPRP
jgi:hypothetical protein